jgi:hypothetical protein
MRQTLPSATPAQAEAAVRHLRGQGWSEEKLAQFILPYMPREPLLVAPSLPGPTAGPAAPPGRPAQPWPPAAPGARAATGSPGDPSAPGLAAPVPTDVSGAWLDEHLPAMDRRQMRLVVEELERRGWPPGTVALAVLPHLLPKLAAEDARAIRAGLANLGMTPAEIAAATAPR